MCLLYGQSERRIVLRMSIDDECAILCEKSCLESAYCYPCLLFGLNIQLRVFSRRIVWRLTYPLFVSPTSTALICKANNRE